MDKSMIKGVVIGGIAVVGVTAGAVTGYRALTQPKYAEVLAVKEATTTIVTPRQECKEVQVQKQAPVSDKNRVAGTVAGGVVGGLLGTQIGSGRGRTAATVVGAAGGAYAGNQIQKNMQQKDVVMTTETRCETINETSKKLLGYDVTYRLSGKESTVRMSFNPGERIPVKDGKLVLTPPDAAKSAATK